MNYKIIVLATAIALGLIGCAKPKDGKDGGAGPAGSNGAAGQSIAGPKGDTGDAGAVGPSGAQGPTGNAGQDANPVTVVKFCTNAVTVYPSAFAEYGFCISGKLYATYYDHQNAWTAEIVPGRYSSTSTSAPCSFTVLPNCAVTP